MKLSFRSFERLQSKFRIQNYAVADCLNCFERNPSRISESVIDNRFESIIWWRQNLMEDYSLKRATQTERLHPQHMTFTANFGPMFRMDLPSAVEEPYWTRLGMLCINESSPGSVLELRAAFRHSDANHFRISLTVKLIYFENKKPVDRISPLSNDSSESGWIELNEWRAHWVLFAGSLLLHFGGSVGWSRALYRSGPNTTVT